MTPARVAYSLLNVPDMNMAGLHGTVWRGGAAEISVSGIYFRELSWRNKPFTLFKGVLGYQIEAESVPGFIQSDVTLSLDGTIELAATKVALPLSSLTGPNWISGLSGNAAADLSRVRIENGIPVLVAGNVSVSGLLVPFLSPESLGNYQAEIFTQDQRITATIEDSEGVVDLAGTVFLDSGSAYSVLVKVVTTAQTPDSLKRFLPPANERGQHELRLEGTL